MKNTYLRCLAIVIVAFHLSTLLNAQTVGTTFSSADGKMVYTVTAVGDTNTVDVKKLGNPVGRITIPDTVNYNSKTFLVTTIGSFKGCTRIDTLTIGKNITQIDDHAFNGCDSITEINYNATNCEDIFFDIIENRVGISYAFLFNSNELCTVNIGSNVQRIPAYIFYKQTSIKAVNFLGVSSCKTVGVGAFNMCNNEAFTQLILPDSLQKIEDGAFAQCLNISSLTIGRDVSQIGMYAFGRLKKLETVYFNASNCLPLNTKPFLESGDSTFVVIVGKNVTKIPSRLFYIDYNTSSMLRSVLFENGSICSEIGDYAFANATHLSAVTLPESIKTIGAYAFGNGTGLKTVSIPKSVSSIASDAFLKSSGLFVVDTENPNFSAVDGILYNKDQSVLLACPITQKSMLTIRESVKSIGSNAFSNYTRLASITIPSSVTTIGKAAFENCKGLHSILLPHSIDSIGDMAFQGCENLTFFISHQSTPPKLGGNDVFNGKPSRAILFVPIGSKGLYDSAFRTYFNPSNGIVEGMRFYTAGDIEYLITDTILKTLSVFRLNPAHSDSTLVIPSTIPYNSENYSVTAIGNDAFNGCTNLSSITLPNSVSNIGNYAFSGCSSLTALSLPESVKSIGAYAFKNCTKLNSIVIPDSTQTIGTFAFYNCNALYSCTIGKAVRIIGNNAFQQCSTLKSIIIPDSTQTIGAFAFTNCTALDSCVIGKTVSTIGNNAFENCTALKSIVLPDAVTTLNRSAFKNCTALTSCMLSTSIKTINDSTFQACSALKSICIPDSVKTVGAYAFSKCSSMDSLDLGTGITGIGIGAFESCENVTTLTIPESIKVIRESAFDDCPKLKCIHFNAIQCDTMGLQPSKIQYLTAFGGCNALTTIVIGDKATVIPKTAFFYIKSLLSVSGGRSLKRIGQEAFSRCINLSSVTICDSITFIDISAFSSCSRLTSITLNAIIPPTLGSYAFSNLASTAKLYVPVGCKENYKNTNLYTNFFSTTGTTDGARIIEQTSTAFKKPADNDVTITTTSEGKLVVQGANELNGTASVYNLAGQQLMENRLMGTRTVLPEVLVPGMYVVFLQTDESRKTVKIRVK